MLPSGVNDYDLLFLLLFTDVCCLFVINLVFAFVGFGRCLMAFASYLAACRCDDVSYLHHQKHFFSALQVESGHRLVRSPVDIIDCMAELGLSVEPRASSTFLQN